MGVSGVPLLTNHVDTKPKQNPDKLSFSRSTGWDGSKTDMNKEKPNYFEQIT